MNSAHNNRGFSMIEVLVTIVLISIGVLGLELYSLQGDDDVSRPRVWTRAFHGAPPRQRSGRCRDA